MNRFTIFIILWLHLALVACNSVIATPTPDTGETINPTAESTPAPVATATMAIELTATVAPTFTNVPTPTETPSDVRGTPVPGPTETVAPSATTPVRGTPEPLATGGPVDDSLGLAVPMTPDLLRNSEYLIPSAYGVPVQLENGIYEERSDPNATLYVRLLEPYIAFGDVDGDGLEDAVVPFGTNTGGSGVFIDIVLVSGKEGTVTQLADAFLGDRVILTAITVEPGIVTVDMVMHGPNDPSCCPTLNVTVPFVYENGTLTAGDPIENGAIFVPAEDGLPEQISLRYGGFAGSAAGEVVPFVPYSDGPAQSGHPAHYLITFDGQEVTREFVSPLEPQMRVWPVAAYRSMYDDADFAVVGERIDALRRLLDEQPDEFSNDMNAELPLLPVMNAAQVLHARVDYYQFPRGSGIGYVTYYAQAVTPIVSGQVFYTFQGLTDDGKFLITFFQPLAVEGLYQSMEEVPANFYEQVETPELAEAYRLEMQALLENAEIEAFTPDLLAIRTMLTTLEVR